MGQRVGHGNRIKRGRVLPEFDGFELIEVEAPRRSHWTRSWVQFRIQRLGAPADKTLAYRRAVWRLNWNGTKFARSQSSVEFAEWFPKVDRQIRAWIQKEYAV